MTEDRERSFAHVRWARASIERTIEALAVATARLAELAERANKRRALRAG